MNGLRRLPALLAGLFLVSSTALAGWRVLGSRTVDRQGDRDEIAVTATRGDFRGIKLGVTGAAIEFREVHVIYGNGQPDKLDVRQTIPPGGETRVVDLQGNGRVIRKIVFWYRTEGLGKQRAVVTAFGLD